MSLNENRWREKNGLVSNATVTSVCRHFCSHGVENRMLPIRMSSLLESSPLCLRPPVFLSGNQIQKTVRNSVVIVDGVIVQTSITNVNVDEGVFYFISFSPPLSLFLSPSQYQTGLWLCGSGHVFYVVGELVLQFYDSLLLIIPPNMEQ